MADFSFEGLLGGINNAFSGGGNYLDEYLTPEQRRMMQRNAMLAASAALLKAGGESTRRIGIGEALGEALQAGQGGYEKAQTGALTQMAMKQKMDEAKRAAEFQKTIAGVFNQPTPGQAITPDQALAIPGMAAGPTLERAAMIGQPAPEVDARLQKSKQYSTLASIYAAAGKTEEAARMQKLSDDLNPRDEVQGAPIEVTNAQGNPVLIQQMKSGSFRPVVGYGAKQGAIGQPFELTGADGKPILVQQLPDGSLRQVTGVSAKQAAPGQPIEMTDAEGKSVMVQPMPDGTFRPVAGFTPKQAAPSQPFELTGADGKPMLVQQLSDGTLRQVTGATPKQAAPSQPIEMTDAQGQSVMVQQMPDGTLRPVSGFGAKQAAPSQPFEMTDAQGKSVMVQQMADGSLRPVTGFAPKLDAAVPPVEVTGADGKPILITPQRGGGFTPVVGVGPKQNPSEKSRQLAELGLTPTLENFQLLESSPNEIKLLNKMGMPVTMANVERIRRSGAASTVVNMNEGQKGLENVMKIGAAFKSEPIYKEFQGMQTAFNQVNTALNQETPIGDLAGATKMMKMMDEGSTVRESELALAMAAAGRMDRLKNYLTQAMTGEKLTPKQRIEFKALSNELYAAAGQAYNNKRSEYQAFAEAYQLPNISTAIGAPVNVPSIIKPVAAPGARPADIQSIIDQYRRTR